MSIPLLLPGTPWMRRNVGCKCGVVKLNTGIGHSGSSGCVHFQPIVVRRYHCQDALASQSLHNRNSERRTFFWIGAGPQFIHEHQRWRRDILKNLPDVDQVRREGAQVLRNRLTVSDVCEYLLENANVGRSCWNG